MARFKKLTKEDARYSTTGTSLKGYLKTGIRFTDLYQTLGEPTFKPEDSGDGKIQYEWVIEYKGDIFTIYDWKTYDERYTVEELNTWSIGGKTSSIDFETMVLHLIANQPVT